MTERNTGKKKGRKTFAARVATKTPERLAEIALAYGYYYIGEGGEKFGAVGQMLDAIADGTIRFKELIGPRDRWRTREEP